MPDDRAADLIREDGVDILVDLAGHTAQNRLLLFACKPAPIQMTYLGYPGTRQGCPLMDYRLTDALADPPGLTESHFVETLLRLPRVNWCFSPIVAAAPVGPLPAAKSGARSTGSGRALCFGSFSNFAKITDVMLQTWAKLLLAVPGSRLMLKAKALAVESVRQQVLGRFSELGVLPSRLELRGRLLNPADHLAAYGQVDIALDTFPYHGTTTTCEAFWMGVPVVTLAGNTHVSRVGVSLLTHVGLAEMIAQTPEGVCRNRRTPGTRSAKARRAARRTAATDAGVWAHGRTVFCARHRGVLSRGVDQVVWPKRPGRQSAKRAREMSHSIRSSDVGRKMRLP